MALTEFVENLSADKRYRLAIMLAKAALPIWDQYADKNELKYRDSVVGMMHIVDRNLLQDSIDTVERYLNSHRIKKIFLGKTMFFTRYHQFRDPIVALQDIDWELPYEVARIFYSVYNLVNCFIGAERPISGESMINISINQAIDALETSKMLTFEEINQILFSIGGA